MNAFEFQKKVIYDFYNSDSSPILNNTILYNADKVRLAAIQCLTEALEPLQERAILEAHHSSKNSSLHTMAKLLAEKHLSEEIIFGKYDWTKESREFPGIFRLGLIGNSIPSEDLLELVRSKLKDTKTI